MKLRSVVVAAGLSLVLGGCEVFGVDCTTIALPSLKIEAVDSVTGDPLPDPLVWVKDGSFQDTLQSGQGFASGPYERAGTYEIHVEHADYEPWVQSGIRVTEDECHVRTREVVARLQPVGQ